MLRRFANVFLAGTIALGAVSLTGCGPSETKLTQKEEQNFKGSSDMSEEAKKRMAEGMKRMAEIQKANGKVPQGSSSPGG